MGRAGVIRSRTGEVFDRLTVGKFAGQTKSRNSLWECHCICGATKIVKYSHLKSGDVRSCGCLEKEVNQRQNERQEAERQCNRCGVTTVWPDGFAKNYQTGKRKGFCNKCQCAAQLASKAKKPDEYKSVAKRRRLALKKECMQKVVDYLRLHPCVDCGQTDWMVLQFDHVRGEKSFGISHALGHRKWEAIEREIAKCDVRCSYCHIKRHIKENGWLKYIV